MGARRGIAAAATVVVAAGVNVTTGMLTQHWEMAWWVATGVLVGGGGALQAWLTVRDRSAGPAVVSASGDGAVAAGGSVRNVSTRVTRSRSGAGGQPRPDSGAGVSATGLGAVAAGSDIERARTEVTGEGRTTP